MTKGTRTYQWCIALLLCFVQTAGIAMYGQNQPRAAARRTSVATDSLAIADSIAAENKKRLLEMTSTATPQVPPASTDSLHEAVNKKVFIPNPTKATWLALVIPGGGQIYNRKYRSEERRVGKECM